MSRAARVALALGALGIVLLLVLRAGGQAVLPSYLAAFLFVLALPLGALPLVMARDLLRLPETPLVAALRSLLPLVGLAVLMAIPVALGRAALYPAQATGNAFAAAWTQPAAVTLRGVLALVLWVGLAVVFRRAARGGAGRPALAGVGLVLHLVLGTMLADDWVAAVEPGLGSSSFGLTLLAAQAGIALSAAGLLVFRADARAPGLAPALLVAFGFWLFLAFSQYLVVWSANLPTEVPWYLGRDAGLGGAAEALAGLVFLVALVTLLPRRGAPLVAATAAAMLVTHLVAMFWLVLPASRGALTVTLADGAATIGLVGLAAGCGLLFGARRSPEEVRHAGR